MLDFTNCEISLDYLHNNNYVGKVILDSNMLMTIDDLRHCRQLWPYQWATYVGILHKVFITESTMYMLSKMTSALKWKIDQLSISPQLKQYILIIYVFES